MPKKSANPINPAPAVSWSAIPKLGHLKAAADPSVHHQVAAALLARTYSDETMEAESMLAQFRDLTAAHTVVNQQTRDHFTQYAQAVEAAAADGDHSARKDAEQAQQHHEQRSAEIDAAIQKLQAEQAQLNADTHAAKVEAEKAEEAHRLAQAAEDDAAAGGAVGLAVQYLREGSHPFTEGSTK